MLAIHEIGYQNQASPMTVLGSLGEWGQLGQVHHAAIAPITDKEVIEELEGRGYMIQEAAPVHHVPAMPTLSRSAAIRIGVDTAIYALRAARHNIPIGDEEKHPWICPNRTGCYIVPDTWYNLIKYTKAYAVYYLRGGALPNWVRPEHLSGLYGYLGQDMPMPPALPGEEPGLFERHPWLAGLMGGVFSGLGTYFTSRMLAEEIKKNLPKEGLSEADKAELRQFLLARAPAGTEGTVGAAVTEATTASWIIPVMIGGVIFLILIMMMKR